MSFSNSFSLGVVANLIRFAIPSFEPIREKISFSGSISTPKRLFIHTEIASRKGFSPFGVEYV